MANELQGKKIAFIATEGVEQAELTEPWKAVAEAGADDYDGLVLPGGVANPDQLRTDENVVSFIREFATSGKPIGVICHGPWTLIEAGGVAGRTNTPWPSPHTHP